MADVKSDAETAAKRPGFQRVPRPIAVYLLLLAVVALVPTFVFSAILLQRNNEAQERIVQELINGTTRSIVQAVDRELTANITTLKVLAATPSLLDRNFAGFHDRAKAGLEGTNTSAYLLDDQMTAILNSNIPYPSPMGPINDPVSGRKALEQGSVVVSDLVLGSVSKRYVYNILQPVYPRTGSPLVLGMSRDGQGLAATLLADKLPEGWRVSLVDGNGRVIAGSEAATNTGNFFTLTSVEQLQTSKGWIDIDANGIPAVAVVQRSALTGWALVAWAPREIVAKPLSDAMWSLIVGGLLLAATAILAIYWVSLQIGRSVHRVEDDAKLLGAGELVPPRNYPITEIANVADALSEASRRRRAADVEVRFLMRELAHRSKNQMTVIAAMAKQTAKGADSVPDFVASFEKRIFGLARSTDLLLANGAAGVDLAELLHRQIEPFCTIDNVRVALSGPPVRLNIQAAQILGMAAHELATNAVKYGAFSRDAGSLRVAWSRSDDRVDVLWRESVPLIGQLPDRKGFGTTVLENMVGRALGADVVRKLHPDGIEWSFSIPVEALDPGRGPQVETEVETAAERPASAAS